MNTDKDIDKTIEKIDADLKANEQPLPKAAPTQYRLHQRPREMSPRGIFGIPTSAWMLEQFVVEDASDSMRGIQTAGAPTRLCIEAADFSR